MTRLTYDARTLKETYLNPNSLNTFIFNPNLSMLDEGYRKALPKLLEAIEIMDKLFLMQDHPQALRIKNALLKEAERGSQDAKVALTVFEMFNGPEGLTKANEVVPLFQNVRPRPAGGTVYTEGVTAKEIDDYLQKHPEKAAEFNKINTAIRRKGKGFVAVPYEVIYAGLLAQAADLLRSAASDVPSEGFARYLRSRADALVQGDYFRSDIDFVKATDSPIDLLIGPLEDYHDMVQSKKSFYAGLLCINNPEESVRVSEYIKHLQSLENMLPQGARYVKDMSRINIPVAVVDVIAMAGEFQAKRPNLIVGETLPNDPRVLSEVGRKIFIYKNVISGFATNQERLDRLIDPKLHQYITNRGRVNFVVGHEVSHSLGPKLTDIVQNGTKVSVSDALGFYAGIIEELKADLLSAYNLPYLVSNGIYSETEAKEIYAEGCLSRNLPLNKPDQGKDTHYVGTLMKLNYFIADGTVCLKDGKFSLDFAKAAKTTKKMVEEVIAIQSEGNKENARAFIEKWSAWTPEAEYAATVAQQCSPKFYKTVIQPSVHDLLRQ